MPAKKPKIIDEVWVREEHAPDSLAICVSPDRAVELRSRGFVDCAPPEVDVPAPDFDA